MGEVIIAALIAAAATLGVCLINNHFQNKASGEKHKETIALIEYKLDELTKRVEKHNNVIERTYALEKRVAVDEEKFNDVRHRVEDLEKEE